MPSLRYIYPLLLLISSLSTPAISAVLPIPEDRRCKVLGNNPNDGPKAMKMFKGWVSTNFSNVDKNNADFLWRDITEWNTPNCITDDGMPRLAVLLPGLNKSFRDEQDWSKSLQRVDILKQKFPQADFLGIIEAEYWKAYAWNARGGGFASTVSEDGWKLFNERMQKARKILIDTKSVTSKLPNWYEQMIQVEAHLSDTPIQRYNVFKEGAERYKSYVPIYTTMIYMSTPKWGGSWEEVDKLITWSVNNTKAQYGNAMYAVLYSNIDISKGESFFDSTKFSWKKMDAGFQDLIKQYPNSLWNLNVYTRFSCMAGDKKTYIKLRKQIENKIYSEAWGKTISVENCDQILEYVN